MAEGGVASGASGFQIIALGTAQTIAWASSAYLPAVISQPVAHTLGVSTATVFAAYSFGLLVMAALGPVIGRSIDRHGGRGVLCFSNVVFVAGLLLLASASSLLMLFAAWAVIGAGMALGLYDAAFAALVRQHGTQARQSITGITLLAGFASTIGWPLTSAVVAASDWPTACLMWEALHLLIALPLNWLTLSPAASMLPSVEPASATAHPDDVAGSRRAFVLVAIFGTATSFVTSAMAAHLPGLLQALGVAAGLAIAALGTGRAGPGGGAGHRIYRQQAPAGASPEYGSGGCHFASGGRAGPAHRRRNVLGARRLCPSARRRQRPDHHRQGHFAARPLRRQRLRRPSGRAGHRPATGPGCRAVSAGAHP